MPCTTILVGKNASYDGSTLVARNEDSPAGEFTPKKLIVVHPKDQPKIYKSVISKVEIKLPENPMKYTLMPDALGDKGVWGGFGVNELNVSMSATETITSNERVLSADPLVKYEKAVGRKGTKNYKPEKMGGIGEEDIPTIVLPYIKSAREGVLRLGNILEEYGTYEMNGIAFQDENEIWWLETIGGHHWIAKRVPNDAYVTMPNQQGIDEFNLDDAFGKQKEHMCSKDLREFIKDNHLNLSMTDEFNARLAFGSWADADHTYNTPRAWIMQRFFNPNSEVWDGIYADYKPDSNDIPWCRVPERKITVEDVKYILSHHFQGTPYDPYDSNKEPHKKSPFRPIGISRNNFLGLVQIRPYMPEEIKAVQWFTYGSNVYNAFIPVYSWIDKTPKYFANTGAEVETDSLYWTNRIISAMADPHFDKCSSHVERFQIAVQTEGHRIIKEYDAKFKKDKPKDIIKHCENANQLIADMVKTETNKLLHNVLYEASMQMKNGFARSDA